MNTSQCNHHLIFNITNDLLPFFAKIKNITNANKVIAFTGRPGGITWEISNNITVNIGVNPSIVQAILNPPSPPNPNNGLYMKDSINIPVINTWEIITNSLPPYDTDDLILILFLKQP